MKSWLFSPPWAFRYPRSHLSEHQWLHFPPWLVWWHPSLEDHHLWCVEAYLLSHHIHLLCVAVVIILFCLIAIVTAALEPFSLLCLLLELWSISYTFLITIILIWVSMQKLITMPLLTCLFYLLFKWQGMKPWRLFIASKYAYIIPTVLSSLQLDWLSARYWLLSSLQLYSHVLLLSVFLLLIVSRRSALTQYLCRVDLFSVHFTNLAHTSFWKDWKHIAWPLGDIIIQNCHGFAKFRWEGWGACSIWAP